MLCGFTVDSLHQHLREHLLAESNGGLFSSNHTALELWTGTLHNEIPLTSDSEILTLILGMLNYDQHSRPNAPQLVSTIGTIGQKYMCRPCHIARIIQDVEGRNITVGTPDQRGQAICEACRTRDLATLRSLLMISDNLDYADINGGTALDISVNSGSEEVTEVLLRHCRAENCIPNSSSALSKALEIGNLTLLQNLLSCGLDPNQTYDNLGLLHTAIRYEDIQAARILLQYDADINMKDGDQWRSTPLHVAARSKKPEFVELLLSHGANVNATDSDEYIPLHDAIMMGELSIVNLLLQARANPNVRRKSESALHIATGKGHAHLIEPLIKAGADPGLQDDEGLTASCIAANRGDFDTLQAIMKCASRGIHRSRDGTTPLHHAVLSGNESVVELLLLETPEDLQIQDNEEGFEFTPLHDAVRTGNETILRMLLLQENPPTRVEDANGFYPLLMALDRDHRAEPIRLLIDRDPETLNMRERKSWLPLHQACLSEIKRLDLVQLMIEQGADVNGRNRNGFTALQMAASRPGSEEILEFLLEKGALVDITNKGYTALGWAAIEGHISNVRCLKEYGKSDLEVGEYGGSQLMQCAYDGHLNAAVILLDHGADIDLRDSEQRTSLSWAIDQGHTKVAKLLIERKCEVEAKIVTEDLTPLMHAVSKNNKKVVKALVLRGIDLEVRNQHGNTALSKAADKGHTDVARVLIEGGAKVKVQDENGWSPLFRAAYRGHVGTARVLVDAGANVDEAWEVAKKSRLSQKQEALDLLKEFRLQSKRMHRASYTIRNRR